MTRRHAVKSTELVPIAERLLYMQVFRLGATLAVAVLATVTSRSVFVPGTQLGVVIGAYVLAVLATELVTRLFRATATVVFGSMLIVDGLFLAYSSYATGGASSLIRYVIVLHLITVSLLASYRTALKLALWHSLLLIVAFYAQRSGIVAQIPGAGPGIGTPFARLVEFSGFFWLVAVVTSSYAAVNERELRRSRYDLEALATMANRLEDVSEPEAVAETILGAVGDTFHLARGLLIVSPQGEPPRVLATYGSCGEGASPADVSDLSVLSVVAEERRVWLVSALDSAEDPWLDTLLPDARNLVVVPLPAEGHIFGALVTEYPARLGKRIPRRVLRMIERFVSHGALALRNAWLLEEIRLLATMDGLTSLANRSAFDETLLREVSRAGRRAEDVSLLMIDIDRFKQLNDTHGHRVGDDVLQRVSAELAGGCREMDVPARYGGEEFAVILPATGREEAVVVAERLRQAIGAALRDLAVTVSVGAATFPLDGATPEELIQAADEALYESKRRGRNVVTSHNGSKLHAAAPSAVEKIRQIAAGS